MEQGLEVVWTSAVKGATVAKQSSTHRKTRGRPDSRGIHPSKHYVRFTSPAPPLNGDGAFQAGTLHVCHTKEALSHYQIVLAKSGRISLRNQMAAQALCEMA